MRTGRPEDCLWVAAYELEPADKVKLDAVEGLGQGYREASAHTRVEGADRKGFLYVAQPAAVAEGLAPFDWYRAMVVVGAAFHRFPEAYVAWLRAVPAVVDPDARRAAVQWQAVAEMAAARGGGSGSHPSSGPAG